MFYLFHLTIYIDIMIECISIVVLIIRCYYMFSIQIIKVFILNFIF